MSIAEQSVLSFECQLIASPDIAQVVLDLYIMAILALIWMYQDIKLRGKTIKHCLPYAFLTFIFVSIGPLRYLALRSQHNDNT
jgi:hypothetical protein